MDDELLTADLQGAVAQYDETLLFLGFDLGDGQLQVMVYPGYRFPGDDRVHGQIGIFTVPMGTRWGDILARVDTISAEALRNYRRCASLRDGRGRSARSSAGYDAGSEAIADAFRESWAAIAQRLAREGCVQRGPITLTGDPTRPFLATWDDHPYTVRVYDTGSALVLAGDRRAELERLEGKEEVRIKNSDARSK